MILQIKKPLPADLGGWTGRGFDRKPIGGIGSLERIIPRFLAYRAPRPAEHG